MRVLGVAVGPREALELLDDLQPEVVIASCGWTERDCASIVRQLKADRPSLPVLVLSPDTRPVPVQATLAAGATGYLPLDADLDELIRGILTVGRGELTLHPAIAKALLTHLVPQQPKDSHPPFDDLTPRERDVLGQLAGGLSDRDIAQALFISVRTVQTHLAHIYEKLGVHSRTEAALIAVRQGWMHTGPDKPSSIGNQ
jgi:DNA-binding NarL/FixJ family response regulator